MDLLTGDDGVQGGKRNTTLLETGNKMESGDVSAQVCVSGRVLVVFCSRLGFGYVFA